jgi:hypothetical protein
MSQKDRVLAALRTHAADGICTTDFLAPDVIDHGKPITRVAARVHELREDGHEIVETRRRHGCSVYRLLQDDTPPTRAPSAAESLGGLFDTAPVKPDNAIMGYEDAA